MSEENKRVLIAHHVGSWFNEKTCLEYEQQIGMLTSLLKEKGISVERTKARELELVEVSEFDGIVFISISFKKDAKELKRKTDKHVFAVTGLSERGDDDSGVIIIEKAQGWHEVARIISESLSSQSGILIRTEKSSVSNRYDIHWRPLPESMRKEIEAFLDENSTRKAEMERGGVVTIPRAEGLPRQEIRYI